VIFLSSPYPAEAIISDTVNRHLLKLRQTSYYQDLVDFYVQCADSAAATVGASFIPQSAETQVAPGFTRAELNAGAVGLAPPKVSDAKNWHREKSTADPDAKNWHREKSTADPWHMNADFGRARLRDIAAAIEVAFGAPGGLRQSV